MVTRFALRTAISATLLVSASLARAQDPYSQKPMDGVLRGGARFTHAQATGACPSFMLKIEERFEGVVADSPPLEQRCSADTSYVLPAADGSRWLAVLYSRFYVFTADSISRAHRNVTRDTAVLITAALFSGSANADSWRAEWIGAADRGIVRSITPTLANRPDGSALVSILYCINGTGGCWQEFMRRRSNRWTEVAQTFWTNLRAATKNRVGKGAGVDVRTLKGSYGVYADRDPNCCASQEVFFSLTQRGNSLLLDKMEIKTSPP